jgi:hypothetical protein
MPHPAQLPAKRPSAGIRQQINDDDHSAGAVAFWEGATVSRTAELIVLVVGLVLALAWLAYSVRKLLESINAIYRLKADREQKSSAPPPRDEQQVS